MRLYQGLITRLAGPTQRSALACPTMWKFLIYELLRALSYPLRSIWQLLEAFRTNWKPSVLKSFNIDDYCSVSKCFLFLGKPPWVHGQLLAIYSLLNGLSWIGITPDLMEAQFGTSSVSYFWDHSIWAQELLGNKLCFPKTDLTTAEEHGVLWWVEPEATVGSFHCESCLGKCLCKHMGQVLNILDAKSKMVGSYLGTSFWVSI